MTTTRPEGNQNVIKTWSADRQLRNECRRLEHDFVGVSRRFQSYWSVTPNFTNDYLFRFVRQTKLWLEAYDGHANRICRVKIQNGMAAQLYDLLAPSLDRDEACS